MEKTKICIKCNIEKSVEEFYIDKKLKDGYRSYCKVCVKESSKKWKENNPDKVKEISKKSSKKWKENNPDKVKESKRKYRENNPDKVKENNKKWKENNPDKVKEISKKSSKKWKENNPEKVKKIKKIWYKNNPKKVKENRKKWKENNPEKVKEINKNYIKGRKKIDINFKILINLRSRLIHALRGKLKADTTKKLLGCSIEILKLHLENQFDDNMNWENYGIYWEIDHILPCSSFVLTDEINQEKCFNWANLQPLTVKDNREKSDKLNWKKM